MLVSPRESTNMAENMFKNFRRCFKGDFKGITYTTQGGDFQSFSKIRVHLHDLQLLSVERLELTTHLFRPLTREFHALVRDGSTCHEAPDLAGPRTNQRKGGRWESPRTENKSSENKAGTL